MVTVTQNPDRYRVMPGEGYDGVVQVSVGGFYGSGVLLNGGRAVLTSAHVLDGADAVTVRMDTPAGRLNISASQYALHPFYDEASSNSDLALVWLEEPAPVSAERSALYRYGGEVGSDISLVGYGLPGDGLTGYEDSGSVLPAKRLAENRVDTTGDALKDALGRGIAWDPLPGSQLIIDFDNGSSENDAFGVLMGLHDLGRGASEGLIAPGDSGGPAFIEDNVAGVATYTATLSRNGQSPDVNDTQDGSFGEIASFQRVSYYQQWIDRSLRVADTDAPTRPEDVDTTIREGDDDTSLVYFLLEFHGERDAPDQWLTVDYATRDGTAAAEEDYIAVTDTLILYPGETQAAIAVEVIGDEIPEPDETFHLDVFNPVGGSFGEGVAQLTAVRTIIDDDGWIA
ncbi:Calx-beta domain-containing protein [Halomonas llamarensis]|uniref:Trypsin-like serine protease n=1 Tax=Halomonas llamarensis TaxID=2945104 RepID=A0ABT0SV16_9GAMM|nr:Calx-beta domain-containing protein [Halomonas llamarensis]MCL7931571.1 trypsin-like serine protease [Halomonas llamarensis]